MTAVRAEDNGAVAMELRALSDIVGSTASPLLLLHPALGVLGIFKKSRNIGLRGINQRRASRFSGLMG